MEKLAMSLNKHCPFCGKIDLILSSSLIVTCSNCKASAPMAIWNLRYSNQPKTVDLAIEHLKSLTICNKRPKEGKTLNLLPNWCHDDEVIFEFFDSETNGNGNLVTGYYIFKKDKKRLAVNHENMTISYGDNYI
ncbi:hypothetical protein [Aliivibrio fischeri]|uniref:hypothetical protein n=1 Tax=Aliivibrio fischeri TaxID=668 RepID=UPI001309D780|nr:hypothetical protein [Aliivibrio fischeri]MUJ20470.1 hypothetical protein [Aliivibrio fischeri]